MTPKQIAELDQGSKGIADMYWNMFSEFVNKGFTREEAIDLVKHFVSTLYNGGPKN